MAKGKGKLTGKGTGKLRKNGTSKVRKATNSSTSLPSISKTPKKPSPNSPDSNIAEDDPLAVYDKYLEVSPTDEMFSTQRELDQVLKDGSDVDRAFLLKVVLKAQTVHAKVGMFTKRRQQQYETAPTDPKRKNQSQLVTNDQARFVERIQREVDDLQYASAVQNLLFQIRERFQGAIRSVPKLKRALSMHRAYLDDLRTSSFKDLSSQAMKDLGRIQKKLKQVTKTLAIPDSSGLSLKEEDFLQLFTEASERVEELETEALEIMTKDLSTNTDPFKFTNDLDGTHNEYLRQLESLRSDQRLMEYLCKEVGRSTAPGQYPVIRHLTNDDTDVVSLREMRDLEAKLDEKEEELKVAQSLNTRIKERLAEMQAAHEDAKIQLDELSVSLSNSKNGSPVILRRNKEKAVTFDCHSASTELPNNVSLTEPWMSEAMYLALTTRTGAAEVAEKEARSELTAAQKSITDLQTELMVSKRQNDKLERLLKVSEEKLEKLSKKKGTPVKTSEDWEHELETRQQWYERSLKSIQSDFDAYQIRSKMKEEELRKDYSELKTQAVAKLTDLKERQEEAEQAYHVERRQREELQLQLQKFMRDNLSLG